MPTNTRLKLSLAHEPEPRSLTMLPAAFRLLFPVLCVCLVLTGVARAQDLGVKAPPQEVPIALVNARVHCVVPPDLNAPTGLRTVPIKRREGREESDVIENGFVMFENGRITRIGKGMPIVPAGTRVIDLEGKWVYPGLVSAYTSLGLTEIASIKATRDYAEVGHEGFVPEVRAWIAVNPDSTLLPVTRANGILTAGVFPGQAGFYDGGGRTIPGRASVCHLDGWTSEDMTIDDDIGLVIHWPVVRPVTAWWMNQSASEQQKRIDERLERIDDFFDKAKAYIAAKDAGRPVPTDVRFESMRGVLERSDPEGPDDRNRVYIMAQDYDQIVSAVGFCQRHDLKLTIFGGRDAPLCADLLIEREVPVIVLGTHKLPKRRDSGYDEPFTLPARLEALGVTWCLASGEETAHERNLPYNAGTAIAHGLSEEAALRSITLSAAEALGVGHLLGSIEPRKFATLIVTDGDPLEITTNVERAFIQGREIDLTSKHTSLRDKYRQKYRQLGILEGEADPE